jgi:glycosyltransferase involved in cell wall biosynthesis
VLIVVNEARFFLTHRLPVAVGAARAGYDVQIVTPRDGPEVAQIEAAGFVVHHLPLDRQGMNPSRDLRSLAALVSLYRRLRPDVVHHVTVKPVLYGSIAARLAGVPAVVNAVSGFGYLHLNARRRTAAVWAAVRQLYRAAFRHPRLRVIFQNPDDRDAFVRAGIARPEQAVLILGSGVDLDAFAPTPLPQGTPVVMLPARQLWDKGVGEFVDAARALRGAGLDARFVLVGDGEGNRAAVPAATLESWVREGVVEWWRRRDDMPATLSAATLVCLPSYREGCPKVLLEAAACARPIVTTNVPGCRDVITDGVEGVLVPPRDATGLAAAVRRCLSDPAWLARAGAAARVRAERQFGVERVVQATLETYAGLLRAPQPDVRRVASTSEGTPREA